MSLHLQDYGTGATTGSGPGPEPDPSSTFDDNINPYSTDIPSTHQFHDNVNGQPDLPPPPPSHEFHPSPPPVHRSDSSTHSQAGGGYPSHDFQPPPPPNRSESSTYSQPYHQQSFPQEPQQHLPNNYPTNDANFNYPNFQSYPSFTETSLPSVPTHYPSYYQGSDTSYSSMSSPPPAASYPSTSQYASINRNGTTSEPAPKSVEQYHYDSNYQPPPEKIAEAHKAARFAVGALAFDDVSVAVEHLKKSLELLTNPSASTGH